MPSVDGRWGAKNSNGVWNGMVFMIDLFMFISEESMICSQIGMIHRGEVDLAPCSFYLTAERKEVVDFSVTLDYAELISGIVLFLNLFYILQKQIVL